MHLAVQRMHVLVRTDAHSIHCCLSLPNPQEGNPAATIDTVFCRRDQLIDRNRDYDDSYSEESIPQDDNLQCTF